MFPWNYYPLPCPSTRSHTCGAGLLQWAPWIPLLPATNSSPRLLLNCGAWGADSAHSRTPAKAWGKMVTHPRRWCPRLTDHAPLAHSEAPGHLLYTHSRYGPFPTPSGSGKGVARAGLPQSEVWAVVLGLPSAERQGLSSLHLFPKEVPEWGHKGRLRTGPPPRACQRRDCRGGGQGWEGRGIEKHPFCSAAHPNPCTPQWLTLDRGPEGW